MPVSAIYCNLSPRGDENRAFIDNGIVIEDCNLSPRGDENRREYMAHLHAGCIAIYPREGTKTSP